jgi:integrase
VLEHLPEHYADVVRFAAFSGWRRSEIQGLLWSEIDEAGGVIRLSPDRSKTREGRVLPIVGPIADVLKRRAAYREHSPLVFTRHVRETGAYVPAGDWRKAWKAATRAAGCPGALLHDLRRTVVRNLTRANVPEKVAMEWTGHKTRSVFDRYRIVRESELHEAGAKLAAYVGGKL